MNIECSKCKTSYNIADSKIPEGGTKVRCKKCQNIIEVMRDIDSLEAEINTKSELPDVSSPKDIVKESSKVTLFLIIISAIIIIVFQVYIEYRLTGFLVLEQIIGVIPWVAIIAPAFVYAGFMCSKFKKSFNKSYIIGFLFISLPIDLLLLYGRLADIP